MSQTTKETTKPATSDPKQAAVPAPDTVQTARLATDDEPVPGDGMADLAHRIEALSEKLEKQDSGGRGATAAWIAAIAGVAGVILTSIVSYYIHKETLGAQRQATARQSKIEEARLIYEVLPADAKPNFYRRKLQELFPDWADALDATIALGEPHIFAELVRISHMPGAEGYEDLRESVKREASMIATVRSRTVVRVRRGDQDVAFGKLFDKGYALVLGDCHRGERLRVVRRYGQYDSTVVAVDGATRLCLLSTVDDAPEKYSLDGKSPPLGTLVYYPVFDGGSDLRVTSVTEIDETRLHLENWDGATIGSGVWGPTGLAGLYEGDGKVIRIEYLMKFVGQNQRLATEMPVIVGTDYP